MTRKLTRIQALITGGAFALAGIGGVSTAAFADSGNTPVTGTEPVAVVQAAAPTVPSKAELHPFGITAQQKTFTPTAEQLDNAEAIVDTAVKLGFEPRAWTIAVATSLQESNLKNLGNLGERNDHDSQGLFQQRPSTGWGTAEQITDPAYATTAFLQGTDENRGLTDIDGWQDMPLTQAAQKVQVSAYPEHYAKHEKQAGDIITTLAEQGRIGS